MITQNDNGSEAMAIINAALEDAGIGMTIGNESGSSTSGKLNEVFGENVLTSALYGSEWVAEVNDGLENLNPPVPHEVMRLLHTSDTHGEVGGLQLCLDMLNDNDVDYLLMSGDLMPYNATQSSPAHYDNDTLAVVAGTTNGDWSTRGQDDCLMNTNRLLYIPGNHDRFDDDYRLLYGSTFYAKGMYFCTKRFCLDLLGNNVVWGVPDADPTDENYTVDCWWYKDITKGEHTVRVIGIDNYAVKFINSSSYERGLNHRVFYTQEQIDWLLDLLYNTPSTYHIIVMAHEPPIQSPNSLTDLMRPAAGDTTAERAQKLFVSELYTDFHARGDEVQKNLLPAIMRAYIHRENINITYQEAGQVYGADRTFTRNVVKDFSQLSASANFIGFVCGHAHGDCVGYIPNTVDGWDDQLLMCIAAGGSSINYSQRDDLLYNIKSTSPYNGTQWASTEPAYRVNELIIDFTDGTLTVKRHGNKTTANVSGRSYGGRVRDEVTFQL